MEQEMKSKVLKEVKGVAFIGIKVSNVPKSVEWYVVNVGCEIRMQHDGYAILTLPWGPDFELHKSNEIVRKQLFGFYVENIDRYHGLLKENDVTVNEIEDGGGCGRGFKMYDPDENEISIWGGYKVIDQDKPDNWID